MKARPAIGPVLSPIQQRRLLLLLGLIAVLLLPSQFKSSPGHGQGLAYGVRVDGRVPRPGFYLFDSRPNLSRALSPAGVETPRNARRMDTTGKWIRVEKDRIISTPLSANELLLMGLPIDLNSVSAEDLDLLPGIGPGLARSIIELRLRLGRFDRLDQLLEVPGLSSGKLDGLRPYINLSTSTEA